MVQERTLVIVRHGQTSYNLEGRYQGHCDIPLSDAGRAEARVLRARLSALEGYDLFAAERTAVVTSNLRRASETAEIAFGVPNRTLHVEPDLREISFGVFEGLTRDEIDVHYPGKMAEWLHGDAHVAVEGGESRAAVRGRAFAAVQALLARVPQQTIVAVTHGGVMRQLVALCFPDGSVPWTVNYANAAVHVLRVTGGGPWSYEREL